MKRYGYIYKTVNLLNGKIYIGQKRGDRFDEKYYGSGTRLKMAVDHFGKINFSIKLIRWSTSQKHLDGLERRLIASYRGKLGHDGLYNIHDGGQSPDFPRTKEHCAAISSALKGRIFTAEWKNKLSQARAGRRLSKAHRLKIAAAHRGRIRPLEVRRKIAIGHKGIRVTEKSRVKISQTMKRVWSNKSYRRHMSEVHTHGR